MAPGPAGAKLFHPETYWDRTAHASNFPQLSGDIEVDVAIIGGGIVGVSTARALKDLGRTVAIVEALCVGKGVTGRSTAKVTSLQRLKYQTLERKFGEGGARLYADAQQLGLRKIVEYVDTYEIDCDLEAKTAYTYASEERNVSSIEKEVEAASRLGLRVELVRETDLPFDVKAAICLHDQAQFHPSNYVIGLAGTVPGNGSYVFENSAVTDWEPRAVKTAGGRVRAKHVVMATNLPLGQVGVYYARAYPKAEPVVAAKVNRPFHGMYINVETPSRSFRTHTAPDGSIYGIAVGGPFKPGDTDAEREGFKEIERWLLQEFDAEPVDCRWVNEDYTSMDQAPFIGWSSSPKDGYLVATGFGAWGITSGTAAGLALADLASGRNNQLAEIFRARRVKPIAGAALFLKGTAEVAAHLVGGYLIPKPKSLAELPRGKAAVMKLNGENVAAFRDENGVVHAVSAACSHMGCLLGWNETDRTWDCPCHGSRFGFGGAVLHGPAISPLKPIQPQASPERTEPELVEP